jgi:hypothetical protein
MRLLHGTSERDWLIIQQSGGIRNPYLTKLETVAWYFAETAAEEARSLPLILDVEVPDKDRLEADLPMFQEPIMEVFEEIGYVSAYAYHQAVKAGDIPWPRNINDWKTSLEIVRSVRYRGVIPADRIWVYERAD